MRAILFDFDGVIIRSMEDHFECWRRALAEYEIEMIPEELYLREGAGVKELASQFTRKFNLPHELANSIVEKKDMYYEQVKKIEFYPYLIDLLGWIREKELKTALVTGGSRDRVISTLESYGLIDRFEVIITADDVQQTKPSPEPYLAASHYLDIEPEHCIVVENAPLGIHSAKTAGMRCIAVTTTLAPAYLKEADVVSDDLNQVLDVLKRMY